jgi:hypothetical protein
MDYSAEICNILDRMEARHKRMETRVMETKERIRKILDDISMTLNYVEEIVRSRSEVLTEQRR